MNMWSKLWWVLTHCHACVVWGSCSRWRHWGGSWQTWRGEEPPTAWRLLGYHWLNQMKELQVEGGRWKWLGISTDMCNTLYFVPHITHPCACNACAGRDRAVRRWAAASHTHTHIPSLSLTHTHTHTYTHRHTHTKLLRVTKIYMYVCMSHNVQRYSKHVY